MRILYKLIAGYVVIVALIWVVGFLSIHSSKEALKAAIIYNAKTDAFHILDTIEHGMMANIEVFQAYQKDLILQSSVRISNRRFAQMSDRQSYIDNHDKAWLAAEKDQLTPFMQEIINTELSEEIREKIAFYQKKYGYRVYGEVFVTNRYGANIAQTGKTTDYRQNDELWWRQARDHGLYVSGIHFDNSAEVYSTDIAIRIGDDQDDFAGVIKVVLNIEGTLNLMRQFGHGGKRVGAPESSCKLVSSTGQIIFSTNDADVFMKNINLDENIYPQQEAGVVSVLSEQNDGIISIYVHSDVTQNHSSPGWGVVIEHAEENVFAPVARLKRDIIESIFIISLLALLLALFLSRSIATPIRRLTEFADRVGQENMGEPIAIRSGGEVGRLASAFNRMMERLHQTTVSRDALLAEMNERKVAERARRESEKQYQSLFEDALDMIHIIGVDGRILAANTVELNTMGYSREEYLGKPLLAMIHPDYLAETRDKMQLVLNGESVSQYETVMLTKAGQKVFVEASVVPRMNDVGEVTLIRGIVRNVTLRKQSDEIMHKLSQAIEHAGGSIMMTDGEGMIEYVNPAFEKMTGYSSADVAGQTPRLLKSGIQDAGFYEDMWATISSGNIWHGKIIDRRKDGNFFPAMLTISPITNQAGEITHFVGAHADMSELENMEKHYYQAQKMEAIGTMVGGIAHNFNNMLAGMTGNLYLAKMQLREQPDVLRKLTHVEQLSHHAAEMIQQLLTFARKGVVSMKAMSLAPFIDETLLLLRSSMPENISMHQDVCRENLYINGDRTQIHQALMNLVNNACDALEDVDEPVITIRLAAFDADDAFLECHPYFEACPYAHLSVEDNGAGIPESHIEHLFEPFFTTREQGKGTGLGLSMVFGAIKTHHGFVEVESSEGKGSTFHIYLPLLQKEEAAIDAVQGKEIVEGRGELILLADDEQTVRDVMAEVLKSLGYRVIVAEDGLEAIEIFQAHQQEVALALLDVVMPHLGGVQLAGRIRALNPELPVIFLTGYDKEQVLGDNEQIQDCEILTKPVNLNVLGCLIRHQLDSIPPS